MMKDDERIRLYCLEVHLTSHCNIACKGCAQSSPISMERFQSVSLLEKSLGRLEEFVSCGKVQVLGGEPLIHPELTQALATIKASTLCTKLSVKTNGLLLHKVKADFWKIVDQLKDLGAEGILVIPIEKMIF